MRSESETCQTGNTLSIAECTYTDPSIQERPNPFYQLLREQSPIYFDEQLGMYLVSRFEDLDTVFRDPVTYSQELGYYSQMAHGYLDELKTILKRDGGGFFPDAVNIDPPRHQRARRLTQQAFTPHRMKALQPEFEVLVNTLIDSFIAEGKADGLGDLAFPMAINFSTSQLKVSDLELETIRRWGSAYLAQFSLLESHEKMLEIAKELCDLQAYLIALVKQRIEEPGEDMLSDLIRARIENDENSSLTFEELVAMARAILINTHDSVSTAMSNILYQVATEPDIASEFYASAYDDTRMNRLVEELIRIEPPVRAMSRMTTKPVALGGKQLPEGAHLLLLFASGNDDETTFSCPRSFDPGRSNLNKSLSFGAGSHLCLGISLARMQLRVAAQQVARRMKNLKLAVPAEEIRYIPNIALLARESLPLCFTPEK